MNMQSPVAFAETDGQLQTRQSLGLDYQRLATIWKPSPHELSLEQALAELSDLDSRNELTVLSHNNTSLLSWLQHHFASLMEQHGQLSGLGKAVCASLWHKQLVDLVMPTLVALRFKYRIVPQQPLLELGLDIQPNGRINTISLKQGQVDSRDEQALDLALAALIEQFADGLLALFAEQKVNKKRFWGNVSNALAQGFSRLNEQAEHKFSEQDCMQMNRWLQTVLPEKACLIELKLAKNASGSLLYVRRKTCCLKYRLDKQRMCKTCNLFDVDEQQAFYRNKLQAA